MLAGTLFPFASTEAFTLPGPVQFGNGCDQCTSDIHIFALRKESEKKRAREREGARERECVCVGAITRDFGSSPMVSPKEPKRARFGGC